MAVKKASKSAGPKMPKATVGKVRVTTDSVAGAPVGNAVPRSTFTGRNASIETVRNQSRSDVDAVRKLISSEGTFSSAAFSFVEVAHTGYNYAAYTSNTHQLDVAGTRLVETIITHLDTPFDYSQGFAFKPTLREVVELMLVEVICSGGLGAELVLDKDRLPDYLAVVAYDTLEKVPKSGGGWYPQQISSSGEPTHLDIPNFFISELHRLVSEAYSRSMLIPAVNGTYSFQGFVEEMRRAVRRSGHSRIKVSLDAEKVRAAAPADVQNDPEKLKGWFESVKGSVEDGLRGLEPEDALVAYDSAEIDMLHSEQDKGDYVSLMSAISGQLATSLKISPSIIGLRISGSQSLSNTESLVFLKVARAIQRPVEDVMSRALTLAARLSGLDVYVQFSFDEIELRPSHELEAHKLMRQRRVLELCSLGFITEDEVAVILKTGARPAGAPALMGTGFMNPKSGDVNPLDVSNSQDPQGRALTPDTPTSPSD